VEPEEWQQKPIGCVIDSEANEDIYPTLHERTECGLAHVSTAIAVTQPKIKPTAILNAAIAVIAVSISLLIVVSPVGSLE
jgi:preprotein translocase subunit Sec61beta